MNRMTTQKSQFTTSKTALVSPSHEQFIPERMKKVNLFARTLGVLVLILASSLGVFGQTKLVGFPGGYTDGGSWPRNANYTNSTYISSANVNYNGLIPYNDSRYVFQNTNSSASLDINTAPYQSLTINLVSGASIDLDRLVMTALS